MWVLGLAGEAEETAMRAGWQDGGAMGSAVARGDVAAHGDAVAGHPRGGATIPGLDAGFNGRYQLPRPSYELLSRTADAFKSPHILRLRHLENDHGL